ncbi:MAG: EAL domain-containing protein [Acidaminobacteraceae bacterium]
MNILKHKKEMFSIVLALIIVMSTWTYVVSLYEENLKVNEHKILEHEFNDSVSDFELSLNQTTTFIYGLRGFVYSQLLDGVDEVSFNQYADKTQNSTYSIRNFSIAPGNIQTFVYPLEGNEITIGHDLNKDMRPNIQADLNKIISSNTIVMSGPYELRQGGLGLIVRDPIFADGEYWGLVNIVVDIDDVISRSNMIKEYSELSFSLKDNNGSQFYGDIYNKEPEFSAEIKVLNEIWTIDAHTKSNVPSAYGYKIKVKYFKVISLFILILVITLIVSNVYKNIMLSDKIKDMIYKDILTGLPNRRALKEKMNEAIKSNHTFSVTFLDLDNFKIINDVLGHSIGDKVLITISKRLKSFENENVSIFRWGGDEFIIITVNYELEEYIFPEFINVIEEIRKPITLFDKEYKLSASAGISFYPADGNVIEDLLKNSDIAMYHAKKSGKNMVRFYNEDIGKDAAYKIELEQKLNHALDENELDVYYQPKIDMSTNKIIGAEALVRWFSDGVMVSPDIFIAVAESNGFIVKIDQFVLRETIKFISDWNDRGVNLSVSCNVSAQQFNEQILTIIMECFEKSNIEKDQLEIEITETIAIENFEEAKELINKLGKIGVGVSLDDFGTGYSSLSYLSKLRISTLKIDKSFIMKLEENSYEKKIVKAIISLANDVNMKIIAEGVETKVQKNILQSLGCHICQGFYYSKALPFKRFEQYFEKYNDDNS